MQICWIFNDNTNWILNQFWILLHTYKLYEKKVIAATHTKGSLLLKKKTHTCTRTGTRSFVCKFDSNYHSFHESIATKYPKKKRAEYSNASLGKRRKSRRERKSWRRPSWFRELTRVSRKRRQTEAWRASDPLRPRGQSGAPVAKWDACTIRRCNMRICWVCARARRVLIRRRRRARNAECGVRLRNAGRGSAPGWRGSVQRGAGPHPQSLTSLLRRANAAPGNGDDCAHRPAPFKMPGFFFRPLRWRSSISTFDQYRLYCRSVTAYVRLRVEINVVLMCEGKCCLRICA